MINELRKKLEKQARILKKIELLENSLNDLQSKIEEIQDKFHNPNDYPELLNNQKDVDIELDEIGMYFEEQIEKQKEQKKQLENQMIQDYQKQMSEISEELISAQEERENADKKIKFWENKTNIKSPSILKKIATQKEQKRILGSYADNLVKKRNEIINEQNSCLNEIIFQKNIIDRYQKLKEDIIILKKQKYNNSIFELLKSQAYQLEQLFYTLNSQRNKIINDNRNFLSEFNLPKLELSSFNYIVADFSQIKNKELEENYETNKVSELKGEQLVEDSLNKISNKRIKAEIIGREKDVEPQEMKPEFAYKIDSEFEQQLIPETTPFVKKEQYTTESISNYFNESQE